jgi:hypothetical protein
MPHCRFRVPVRAAVCVGLVLAGACGRGIQSAAPGAAASGAPAGTQASLPGSWVWLTVDERPAPAEFPAGSGAMLLAGSLELRSAGAAAKGRFGLRFTMRPTPPDTARVTGEDGNFRVIADSLHFVPDGREDKPPVGFRYSWGAQGRLLLTDAQGHVWAYARR